MRKQMPPAGKKSDDIICSVSSARGTPSVDEAGRISYDREPCSSGTQFFPIHWHLEPPTSDLVGDLLRMRFGLSLAPGFPLSSWLFWIRSILTDGRRRSENRRPDLNDLRRRADSRIYDENNKLIKPREEAIATIFRERIITYHCTNGSHLYRSSVFKRRRP